MELLSIKELMEAEKKNLQDQAKKHEEKLTLWFTGAFKDFLEETEGDLDFTLEESIRLNENEAKIKQLEAELEAVKQFLVCEDIIKRFGSFFLELMRYVDSSTVTRFMKKWENIYKNMSEVDLKNFKI